MGHDSRQVIISGFTFYNELDLLEIRLEELDPVVDWFLIVQSDQTFRGEDKPRFFNKKDRRWMKYLNKIIVINTTFEHLSDPWEREIWQRNLIAVAARDLFDPEDILIISDADEIPRREVVEQFRKSFDGPVRLYTPTYYYALNCLAGEDEAIKAARVKDIDTAEGLRRGPAEDTELIPDAGWHFSYLGDADWIRNKIKSFAHSELDKAEVHANVEENMKELRDPFGFGQEFKIEWIDETWPVAVKANPDRWKRFVWPVPR